MRDETSFAHGEPLVLPLAGHALAAHFPGGQAIALSAFNVGDRLIAGRRYLDRAGRLRTCRLSPSGIAVLAGLGRPACAVEEMSLVARVEAVHYAEEREMKVVIVPFRRRARQNIR